MRNPFCIFCPIRPFCVKKEYMESRKQEEDIFKGIVSEVMGKVCRIITAAFLVD